MHLKYLWLAGLAVVPSLPSCGCGGDSFPGTPGAFCPIPPAVAFVVPLDASIGVALDSQIVVTFNQPVVTSTVNGLTFVVVERGGPVVPGALFFTIPGVEVSFDPTVDFLPCTIYDVVVGAGVQDICEQPLTPFTMSFTTTGVNCGPPPPVGACVPPIDFGTAFSFAVLAGTTITNTGATMLTGDLGLSPGSSVTGAPVVTGVSQVANAVALQAKNDLITAYDAAVAVPSNFSRIGDIGGQVLTAGVYTSTSTLAVQSADLTLVGGPDDVFIFQMVSSLTIASGRQVILQGVRPCNVIWQVGSSAIIETGAVFAGSILALTSITLNTGATAQGRMLARNGQVSFQGNTVSVP